MVLRGVPEYEDQPGKDAFAYGGQQVGVTNHILLLVMGCSAATGLQNLQYERKLR